MSETSPNRLVIIDGNAIIHRAYHAVPPLSTKDGVLVNAVYGFATMLIKVWRELKPTHIAVTFDVAGGTFRHQEFKEYKATRVKADQALYDQIPLVHELVTAFGLPIFTKAGYEADDVIGTITEQNKDIETVVVTGDMDTIQLIAPHVKIYTLRKGMSDIVVYDEEKAIERYGFESKYLIDYKGLAGDTSDNIPGVPGIGEVTATNLIKEYGSLEDIFKALDKKGAAGFKPAVYKKLLAGKESGILSKRLATIDRHVPELSFDLDACRLKPFDKAALMAVFQKFEFLSLLKRLPELSTEAKAAAPAKAPARKKTATTQFKTLGSESDLATTLAHIKKAKRYAAAGLLENNDNVTGRVLGLVCVAETGAWYIPAEWVSGMSAIFSDSKIELVGHNLKELVKICQRQKMPLTNQLFDVMVASYLLQPGSRAHDMPSIALKVLGKEMAVSTSQTSLFGVDPGPIVNELSLALEAAEQLAKDLVAIDDYGLMAKIEMPLLAVLADMELNGIAVDTKKLAELSKSIRERVDKISNQIFSLAGETFNIASPIQLREVLFEKMQIPVDGIKKGKTGLSTGAEQLEKLRDLHPIIPEIEQYRELTKLQNTYSDVLPTLVNKTTHRIHTNFNQTIAATGRLSSTDPNLQNIPVRTELGREIRKAFVAEPGNVLLSVDYSQIELRIVASLAEDKRMLEIFAEDQDIHQATAAAINNVPLDKVTKEMRYAAKEVNFGVLYGMGTHGLSWRAGIPYWQAKEFIEKYFEQFKGVREYIDRTLEFTKKEGYCETLFGRRRYIPELSSTNFQVRAAGERMAVNHPIQGTAADLMKLAMIDVYKKLCASKFKDSARLLLQVHDELVLEVKRDSETSVAELLKEAMEQVVKLRVPVKVEAKVGDSWGEMAHLL